MPVVNSKYRNGYNSAASFENREQQPLQPHHSEADIEKELEAILNYILSSPSNLHIDPKLEPKTSPPRPPPSPLLPPRSSRYPKRQRFPTKKYDGQLEKARKLITPLPKQQPTRTTQPTKRPKPLASSLRSPQGITVFSKELLLQQQSSTETSQKPPSDLSKSSPPNQCKVEVQVNGITDETPNFNLVLQFADIEPFKDYSQFYKCHENKFWYRSLRIPSVRNGKWYYYCKICKRKLSSLQALWSHLNMHLQLYPYECSVCKKRYHSYKSGHRHTKKVHNIKQFVCVDNTTFANVNFIIG